MKRRTPLRSCRAPLRKLGRIGRLNLHFSQDILAQWFNEGLLAGNRCGANLVRVRAFDIGRVQVDAAIEIKVLDGEPYYVGHGVQVGHKPGYAKAQEPKHRWDPEVVEPQTEKYNRDLANRGGGRKGESNG